MDPLSLDRNVLMILIMAMVFALIGLIVFGFHVLGGPARQMRKRVERAAAPHRAAANKEKSKNVRRDAGDSSIPTIDRLAKRLIPRPAAMRERLQRTGKDISLGAYFLICILVGFLVIFGTMNLINLPGLPAALVGLAAGVALPHMVVGIMIGRRSKKFIANFTDAIDIMVRGLRSGLPITESITIVGREMSGPVADEFTRVSDAMKVGETLEDTLWDTAHRIGVPEFRFFVIALTIQRETGGNLAETLENLADVLRKRQTMRLKVRALSSEARASAVIIAALPFIMMGIIMSVNSGYIMQLFTDDRGIVMLVAAGISLSLGIFTMIRMIKFEI